MAEQNFIGGQWVDPVGGATDAVIDPATGQEMARAASSDAADVDAAVQAAADAFVEWGATTPADRSAALLGLADVLEAEADALGALESQNVGKPINTMGDEMAMAIDHIRFFAAGARNLDSRAAGEYLAGYTSMLRRDPLGVVASITPWNYPLMMAVWKIGPALAAGNTVVLKPSELTPLTTPAHGRAGRRRVPAGGPERGHRTGRDGRRRAGRAPAGAHGLAHRRRGHRQAHRGQRRPVARPASTSSWAARPRCWCSTTPTSTR